MTRYEKASIVLAVIACFGLSGCSGSSPPRVQPEVPDADAANKAMELYDTNHDGFLDSSELEKVPGLKAALAEIDANHDGKISKQEIADRIRSWADSRAGRVPMRFRVTHNGSPLVAAKVVLVPEKFLGGTLKSGSGTTSETGTAIISAPNPVNPKIGGVSPGFYSVEIGKDGESIPARYNTATTLGTEACSEQNRAGLTFDLNY